MTSNSDDDDDFSPEDAFNMFTPIYWSGSRPNVPTPPQLYDVQDSDLGLDGVTVDASPLGGVTLAGTGIDGGGGPPPDLLHPPRVR